VIGDCADFDWDTVPVHGLFMLAQNRSSSKFGRLLLSRAWDSLPVLAGVGRNRASTTARVTCRATGPARRATSADLQSSSDSRPRETVPMREKRSRSRHRQAQIARPLPDRCSDAAQASRSRVSPPSLLLVEPCDRRDCNGYKGGVRWAVVRRLLCHERPRGSARAWVAVHAAGDESATPRCIGAGGEQVPPLSVPRAELRRDGSRSRPW